MREGDSRAAAGPSGWSPDGSFPPASAVPQALNFSPEKSDFSFSKSITTEVALDEAQPPEATTPSEVREADSVDLCCPGLPPGDRGMSSVTPAPLVPAAPKGRGQDLPPLEETEAASPVSDHGDGQVSKGGRWEAGQQGVGEWELQRWPLAGGSRRAGEPRRGGLSAPTAAPPHTRAQPSPPSLGFQTASHVGPKQSPLVFPGWLTEDARIAFQSCFLPRIFSWMSNWISLASPCGLQPHPWATSRSSTSARRRRRVWLWGLEAGPWSTS